MIRILLNLTFKILLIEALMFSMYDLVKIDRENNYSSLATGRRLKLGN